MKSVLLEQLLVRSLAKLLAHSGNADAILVFSRRAYHTNMRKGVTKIIVDDFERMNDNEISKRFKLTGRQVIRY